MIKIDAIDKAITDLLIEDGRMSCASIAARLPAISERAVRYRIERLIKHGVIVVRANVIAEGLGLEVCADVFIEVDPDKINQIAQLIARHEAVAYLAYATGDTDISIQVFARDNHELFQFVTEVVGKIPGVRKTHISLVPVKVKDDHVWQIPSFCVQPEKSKDT